MEQEQNSSLFDMNIDAGAQSSINSVSKWTRFISITGFVGLGLILLVFALAGQAIFKQISMLSELGSSKLAGMILIIVIVMVLVLGVWVFLMFKASTQLKKGLDSKNSSELAEGFRALRSFFIFSVIMSILSLLYAVSTILNF